MLTKNDFEKYQGEINRRMSAYLQMLIRELHEVDAGTKVISAVTEKETLQPRGFLYNVKLSVQLTLDEEK